MVSRHSAGPGVRSEVPGSPQGAAPRPVDARALERHALRLLRQPAPWLHEEVARRMAERLGLLKQAPRRIVDWGAQLGGSAVALRRACPQAQIVAAEVWPSAQAGPGKDPAVAEASWWSARRWWPAGARARAPAGAESRPASALREGEADLVWSNMVLHHRAVPQACIARWLRLLQVDGLLMFSTLGPGTLQTLRRVYAAHGWPVPHAAFVDMHDIGDMLVQAGFADPVMDQEVLTLTWPEGDAALAELRQLGGNADPARYRGLRTPRWRAALAQALGRGQERADGRVALEFEVVYGHAVRTEPRVRVAGETAVSLEDMRDMLRPRARGKGAR